MTETSERTGAKTKKEVEDLKTQVAELKRVQVAILEGFKELEAEQGEAYMPQGEYHGIKFED